MNRLVFLLEERSMAETLRIILPKAFPLWQENVHWISIPHEGKSDLEGAIPRKLRAWNRPGDRFIIVRDNDGADCLKLKSRLLNLASVRERNDVLVRIVCQELEGWFLGDMEAVDAAFPRASSKAGSSLKSEPDTLTNASSLLSEITGEPGKITKAKAISPHMELSRNRSKSFRVFLQGINKMVPSNLLPR